MPCSRTFWCNELDLGRRDRGSNQIWYQVQSSGGNLLHLIIIVRLECCIIIIKSFTHSPSNETQTEEAALGALKMDRRG